MQHRANLYDLDFRDEVSCATLFRYFEETAIQASAQLGFGMDWYRERGQFWVIRTMRMERLVPIGYGEEVEVTTWVSSMTRVRADRNYLVRRVRDRQVLARATANWVYLDGKTLFPARIAPEIVSMFQNPEPAALPANVRAHPLRAPAEPIEGKSSLRAQYYEADSALRTNNAIYVDWLEEAVRGTLLNCGYGLPLEGGPLLRFYRHQMEYLVPTRPGDEIEVETRLTGRGRSAAEWSQEIRRAGSREVVLRGNATTIWQDQANRPIHWPPAHVPVATTL